MKNISQETFLIYGYGIFEIFLAWKLAQKAKEVQFFRPWMSPFPTWQEQYVGKGLPWLKRVDSWEDAKADVIKKEGVFCFFDIGDGDKQAELRRMGARVFGAGESGVLEMDRLLFKRTLKDRGLPVPTFGSITGTDALGTLLKKEEDLWIKLDVDNRGIMETRYHGKWATSQEWFYQLVNDLGCSRSQTKFMWEKPIKGVEPGWDNFVVNGSPFKEGLMGWENKGDGYVCKHIELDKMPKPLLKVHTAMLPVEKKYKTSGAVSSEVRVNEQSYFIDACRRMGNPPAACISAMYNNFPEIVAGIADGIEVTPEWTTEYAAEITVEVPGADKKCIPMELKEKDFETIKVRCACNVDGILFNVPFDKLGNTVVKAVGLGSTREEAEFNALESADNFTTKCKGAFYNKATFEDLEKDIEEGRKYGLNPDDF